MAYIDGKKVKRKLQYIFKAYGISEFIKSKVNKALAECTTDVVEVVRCKDCKHWMKDVAGCTDVVGRCEYANYMVGANGYCVYGEKTLKERAKE